MMMMMMIMIMMMIVTEMLLSVTILWTEIIFYLFSIPMRKTATANVHILSPQEDRKCPTYKMNAELRKNFPFLFALFFDGESTLLFVPSLLFVLVTMSPLPSLLF